MRIVIRRFINTDLSIAETAIQGMFPKIRLLAYLSF